MARHIGRHSMDLITSTLLDRFLEHMLEIRSGERERERATKLVSTD